MGFRAEDVEDRVIYDKLQDEESREIYKCRYESYRRQDERLLCGLRDIAFSHLDKQPVMRHVSQLELKKGCHVLLFGLGKYAKYMSHHLFRQGFYVKAYIDNDKTKIGNDIEGVPVYAAESIAERFAGIPIIITSTYHESDIYNHLLNLNVLEDLIYSFGPHIIKNYFKHSFLAPVQNEIYINAGAHNMQTINDFLAFSPDGYKAIYAVEPDRVMADEICAELNRRKMHDVALVRKALWSSNTTLHFSNEGEMMRAEETGNITAKTTTIDDIAQNNHITFITMDIEGAELEALKGAIKTIKTCKPRLAISIYHKLEDICTIPRFIENILPEYRYFIRHMCYGYTETVLYAVP